MQVTQCDVCKQVTDSPRVQRRIAREGAKYGAQIEVVTVDGRHPDLCSEDFDKIVADAMEYLKEVSA